MTSTSTNARRRDLLDSLASAPILQRMHLLQPWCETVPRGWHSEEGLPFIRKFADTDRGNYLFPDAKSSGRYSSVLASYMPNTVTAGKEVRQRKCSNTPAGTLHAESPCQVEACRHFSSIPGNDSLERTVRICEPCSYKAFDANSTGFPSIAISSPIVDPKVSPTSASSAKRIRVYRIFRHHDSNIGRQCRFHLLIYLVVRLLALPM